MLLRDVFFVRADQALPEPRDFARNIVRWKSYDLERSESGHIRSALEHLLRASQRDDGDRAPMFGDPRLVAPRLGQSAFRALVTHAYGGRCAITGNRVTPTLQAAHIRPVAAAGEHLVDNGLLLRSDIHTLFDRGYIGVDREHRLQVSGRLRSDFGNGRELYDRQGTQIGLPDLMRDQPRSEFVEWHMDEVFLR